MKLKDYINLDKRMEYLNPLSKSWFIDILLHSEQYLLRRFLRSLRSEEFYSKINPNKILKYYYQRRKNIIGSRLGFFIPAGCFDEDLKIYHYGSIIIHPKARIGKHCTIHGNCCIGSKGGDLEGYPRIGNNVDIGQNAQIIGDVYVADNVKIGAGSIVTKSIKEQGVTVIGIPAKIIDKN